MPVRHVFESPVTDGGDPDLVGPDEWNDDHTGDPFDLSVRCIIRNDMFLASTSLDGLTQSNSGGLVANTAVNVDESHPGVVNVSTGTGTTGRACIIAGGQSSVALGGGAAYGASIAKMGNLSDGTDTFTVRMGFGDSSTGEPVHGAYFRYTHSVNGGRWEAVCRDDDVETATDTGVTADTSWHRFEIRVNAAATSVDFLIDGTVEATVTTNIPVGTGDLTAPMPISLIKSAGTTSRSVYLDAYAYIFEFTTPR